jgi:hypothetical protein
MRSAALLGGADREDRDVRLPGHFKTYRDAKAPTDRPPGTASASGRPTIRRAGLVGAALGAWLGMLTVLLVGVLLPGVTWLPMLLSGLAIGASAGGALGLVTHWAVGRRDYPSSPDPRRALVRSGAAEARGLRSGPRGLERTVPGLGLSCALVTADGRRIAVVAYPSGRCDPISYDLLVEDRVKRIVVLTDIEARRVAQLLGKPVFRGPGDRSANAAEPSPGMLTVRRVPACRQHTRTCTSVTAVIGMDR